MNTRFYQSPGLDSKRLVHDFENVFLGRGYQVQHFGNNEQTVIQLRKGGDFEALIGLRAALTLTLRTTPEGIMAVVGQQQWVDKAAGGAIGVMLLWPLAITAGAGMIQQATLESEVFSVLDAVALQQKAGVGIGPIPPHMQEQMQYGFPPYTQAQQAPPQPKAQAQPRPATEQAEPRQQTHNEAIPMPPPGKVQCVNCLEVNDASDLYCSRCGNPLHQRATKPCPRCQAEVKASAAFCTKCGTAFAQS